MSKFSKWVFVIYILTLFVTYLISKYVYWGIISTVLFLQISNFVSKNWVDNMTKYKDSISHETEKLRFFYMYFGFPIVVCFPKQFRQIRKDSYYERRVKELDETVEFYNKCGAPITDELKDEIVNCNRYLKLKKIRHKQEEHESGH